MGAHPGLRRGVAQDLLRALWRGASAAATIARSIAARSPSQHWPRPVAALVVLAVGHARAHPDLAPGGDGTAALAVQLVAGLALVAGALYASRRREQVLAAAFLARVGLRSRRSPIHPTLAAVHVDARRRRARSRRGGARGAAASRRAARGSARPRGGCDGLRHARRRAGRAARAGLRSARVGLLRLPGQPAARPRGHRRCGLAQPVRAPDRGGGRRCAGGADTGAAPSPATCGTRARRAGVARGGGRARALRDGEHLYRERERARSRPMAGDRGRPRPRRARPGVPAAARGPCARCTRTPHDRRARYRRQRAQHPRPRDRRPERDARRPASRDRRADRRRRRRRAARRRPCAHRGRAPGPRRGLGRARRAHRSRAAHCGRAHARARGAAHRPAAAGARAARVRAAARLRW